MALSKNGEIFYNHIFPNIKYDKELGKYRLNLTAYIPYGLNKRQTSVLERICINNNIYMEKLPEKISIGETENLFLKMKYLKELLKKDIFSREEKSNIQEKIYKIRHSIFEGNQYLIYKIILDNYPNLESSPLKEDIIQSSYEYLLHAIDCYDIDKSNNQNFRWYIHVYTSKNIIRNIINLTNQGSNKELMSLIDIREQEKENNNIPTTEELSILTDLPAQRVEELLTLEQILNAESIEQYEKIQFTEDKSFNLEDIVNRKLLQEKLIKMLDLLSNETQKEVIKLYCGLDRDSSYRIHEIATILNLFRQRVDQHRNDAVDLLSHPARLKYIKELYEGYCDLELPDFKEEELFIDETEIVYEKLERKLFELLPKEELISMINKVDSKYQRVLLVHFDLTNEIYETFTDRVKSSNVSTATYIQRKKEGLRLLRKIFKEKYILNNPNEEIKTTLDYLMYNYLNKSKTKTRKKDGTN